MQVSFRKRATNYRALLQKIPIKPRNIGLLHVAESQGRHKTTCYVVAVVSRIDKIIGLFCKRAL